MSDQPGWAAEQPPPPPGWRQPGGDEPAYGQPPTTSYGAAPPAAGWGAAPATWGTQAGWAPPKPGVIPLRPLGVGEILDGAISTIRARPRIMLGLSALVAVATQLVMVPVTWVLLHDLGDPSFSVDPKGNDSPDFAASASAFTAAGLQVVLTLVATLLLTGILTVVVSRAVLGQPVETAQAWDQARPRIPALLGVTLLVMLIALGAAIVTLSPAVVLLATGAPVTAVVVAFLVGVPALVCIATYCYVAFALAPAAVVLERAPVLASLRRSRRLVRGAWWRTFGILLLVNVIAQVVAGILAGIFTVASYLASGASSGFSSFNPYEFLPLVIGAVGTILASTITWPFTAVSTALIYVDRRMRREGLDIELTRAAGLAPPGQAATPGTPLQGEQPGYRGYPGDGTGT